MWLIAVSHFRQRKLCFRHMAGRPERLLLTMWSCSHMALAVITHFCQRYDFKLCPRHAWLGRSNLDSVYAATVGLDFRKPTSVLKSAPIVRTKQTSKEMYNSLLIITKYHSFNKKDFL